MEEAKQAHLQARLALLEQEKELTRLADKVAAQRRALPKVPVANADEYEFHLSRGKKNLRELFAGRSQLVVYHFMFPEGAETGCPSCSMWVDALSNIAPHLAARDTTIVVVARAPAKTLQAFRARMGWSGVEFASSAGSAFNKDFGVYFTDADRDADGLVPYNFKRTAFPMADAPGVSVFERREDGSVWHTYSAFARGMEALQPVYGVLDMTPKGRDEAGPHKMGWVKLKDQYDHYRAPFGWAVPEITSSDADAHIAWLKTALGAEVPELHRADAPVGKGKAGAVMHAAARVAGGEVYLGDACLAPEGTARGAREGPEGSSSNCVHLNVADADAFWTRALAAGAKATLPLADMFWGDRYGRFVDPYGQEWAVCGPPVGEVAAAGDVAAAAAQGAVEVADAAGEGPKADLGTADATITPDPAPAAEEAPAPQARKRSTRARAAACHEEPAAKRAAGA